MTGMEDAEDTIYKLLIKGATHPDRHIRRNYETMAELFIQGGIKEYTRNHQTASEGSEEQIYNHKMVRHHFDPTLELKIKNGSLRGKELLLWVLTNHLATNSCTTTLALHINGRISTIIHGETVYNTSYRVSYFNTLSALWRRGNNIKESNIIMIHENDSAVKALENLMNRDSKIIELREHLVKNGIGLLKVNKEDMQNYIEVIGEMGNGN